MKRAFTLIEMLVVIGIVAILIVAASQSLVSASRAAQKAKAQDLVQQVATALSAMYEANEGLWPKRLAVAGERGTQIDERLGYAFVSGDNNYLSLDHSGGKLVGYDRFGVLDPWGADIVRKKGTSAALKDVEGHRLWFAVDADGDGVIAGANVGGESVDVRATAIVWCAGKDGKMEPYSKGLKKDDVYSWTVGQTRDVK